MTLTPSHTWWRDTTPRRWQAECLQVLAGIGDEAVAVQAVMGAGKSLLIRELCRQWIGDTVIVTTSSVALVEQLAAVIDGAGRYYTHAHETDRRVTVCCLDSAPALAAELDGAAVDLWIADEAHRTETAGMLAAHEAMAPRAAVGFTATPYRSSKTEELSLFSRLVYEYGPVEALRDGVILPWRVVPWDGDEADLDDACVQLIRAQDGPGVANASSIQDAVAFAGVLVAAGIPSDCVHSALPRQEQARRIEALRTGRIRCLVHVSMLQEGVDLPWLRWLCLRRQCSSRVRFAQEVGRVLRCHPGKTEGIILDPLDLFATHRLTQAAVLNGQAEESSSSPVVTLTRSGEWWTTDTDPLVAGWGVGRLVRLWESRRPTPYHETRVSGLRPGAVQLVESPAWPLCCGRLAPITTSDLVEAAEVATVPAVPLDELTRYLRALAIELEQQGMRRRVASRQWRRGAVYASLWARFRAALTEAREIPTQHRAPLRQCVMRAHEMARGEVLDMTEALQWWRKNTP